MKKPQLPPDIVAKVREAFAQWTGQAGEQTAKVVQSPGDQIGDGHFHRVLDLVEERPNTNLNVRFKKWLHPTKGWREFARPRGTNKRRKLVRQGQLMVYGEIRS